ncbi:MAG TPA: mechanosensitive ion channel family protein [Acidimicrobiales bacterium]|nr:mechanosensitive ion channel family protein [Acidimicrobiales bacterium]
MTPISVAQAGAARVSSASTGYVYDLLRKLGASDFVARSVQFLALRPLRIALIVLIAWLAARVGGVICRRLVRSLQLRAPLLRTSERAESRADTVAGALSGLVRGFVWVIAALTILGELGINLGPFVAGATVIGAALGFGAQSLVRDFLSGLLILVEDQYGVGDIVRVGEIKGTVEGVNLRTTRLRAFDGTVWYLPNGEIHKVGNTSDGWARALVDVPLPHGVDLTRANAALADAARAVASEPPWTESVLEPPQLLGVQEIAPDAVTVRLSVRVAPRQTEQLARAVRGRVLERLRREGLEFHYPDGSTPPGT